MDSKTNGHILERVKKLHQLSREMARGDNKQQLLEMILESMQILTNADGGALYTLSDDKRKLNFEVVCNRSLGIKMGGTSQTPVPFHDLPLYDCEGSPNLYNFLCYAVLKDETLNIEDAYSCHTWDFSKVRKFDKLTRYRSKSFLIVPFRDQQNRMLGIIQLSNAQNSRGDVIPFSQEDKTFVQFMGTEAAVLLTNLQLNENSKKLFESFVQVLASAVDEKSPYTGGHCRRVPVLAMMVANALEETDYGPFKDFFLSPEERYELELAALLHDCGKVTTPVHIMDKATKLETIFDRMDLIDQRCEILIRDAEIEKLKKKIHLLEKEKSLDKDKNDGRKGQFQDFEKLYEQAVSEIYEDRDFLRKCNIGGEFMGKDLQSKVRQIAQKYRWKNPDGVMETFLNHDEIKNLIISRGTLNAEERETINHHAEMTLKMLSQMHFPPNLKRIPEIASCHHEKVNGHGYPRGLKGEEMSVQARLMGVADIFEALTAKDRPYKRGKTLSESLAIMGRMKLDKHIDGDIFDVFMDKKIYMKYAKTYLDEYQIDQVDLDKIPGYVSLEKRYSTPSQIQEAEDEEAFRNKRRVA